MKSKQILQNEPTVSVIIPTFDREKTLGTAIESIISQTFLNWECIVVDDGSVDRTLKILSDYASQDSRIKYLRRKRFPKGAPTCRNIGLEHAKGEFVVFLDSDDYLLPFCLENRLNKFHKNPNDDFLIFPMGIKSPDGLLKSLIPESKDYLINFLSAELPWSIMCPIWKKSTLYNLNGFNVNYKRFNDPELMIRALLNKNVHFKVFHKKEFDCVFIPNKKDNLVFPEKVYDSLIKFIPDITSDLTKEGREFDKYYLIYYLHLWFKYINLNKRFMSINESIRLIYIFLENNIISVLTALTLCSRVFLFNVGMDKLTHRYIYKDIYKKNKVANLLNNRK